MEMAKILEISALKVHYNTVSYPKATVIKATEYDDKQFVSCVIWDLHVSEDRSYGFLECCAI